MGFGKDGKGVMIRESDSITLGTLSGGVAVKQSNPLAITEDFRLIKAEIFATLTGATFVEDDGPILVGISSDELTVAEIAECLQADGPLGPDDRLAMERAERPVWPIFLFRNDNQAGTDHFLLNNGLPIEKTLRWTFSNSSGFTWFAYNLGTGALTTGGVVRFHAKYYGVWVR